MLLWVAYLWKDLMSHLNQSTSPKTYSRAWHKSSCFCEKKALHLHLNLNESVLCSLPALKPDCVKQLCQPSLWRFCISILFSCHVLITNSPFRHVSSTYQLNASIRQAFISHYAAVWQMISSRIFKCWIGIQYILRLSTLHSVVIDSLLLAKDKIHKINI